MTKQVTDYEIFDHGIMFSDYFQGHGIAFTDWDDCATGIGDNPKEALEDCLDMLAQQGDYELDSIPNDLPEKPSVSGEWWDEYKPDDTEDISDFQGDTPLYHVSISVKTEEVNATV